MLESIGRRHLAAACVLSLSCLSLVVAFGYIDVGASHTIPTSRLWSYLGRGTPRIGILSMASRETAYDHPAWGLKQHYAAKHGYKMFWDFGKNIDNVVDIYVDKYRAIQDVLSPSLVSGDLDWLMWMDYDSLITNSSVRIRDIINSALASVHRPADVQLIATQDCMGHNSGMLIFRVSSWMQDFWRAVVICARERGYDIADQHCTVDLLNERRARDGKQRLLVVPQRTFNAYVYYTCPFEEVTLQGQWQHGDFLIHFAGAQSWASRATGVNETEDAVAWMFAQFASVADWA